MQNGRWQMKHVLDFTCRHGETQGGGFFGLFLRQWMQSGDHLGLQQGL